MAQVEEAERYWNPVLETLPAVACSGLLRRT